MELDDAIRRRRSIRRYARRPVEASVVREILELGRHAPSSMNGQPWIFTVVRDQATKRELSDLKNQYCPVEKQDFRADFIQAAPVIVVVCVDLEVSHDRAIENGVLAAANIMLAACARGLGTVYMSAYRQDEPAVSAAIQRLLGLPPHIAPISILPMGYPDEAPGPKAMKPLDGIVFDDRYAHG
ncbi:MAG: nitroreductase family protein [Zetaproteobacteria bacterium]|nr:MAG: nitroreductase family protein [Zetaproteobacteria bacterium]